MAATRTEGRVFMPTGMRTVVPNEDYTAVATDEVIVYSSLATTAKTVTLPAANAVPPNWRITIADESGSPTGALPILLAAAGSDTLIGTTASIVVSSGWLIAVSDGVNSWNILSTPVGTFDGWNEIGATWTRTGNHTFTVSGDVTAFYFKGQKVRFTDTSAKYGVIYSASHSAGTTTITLITNSDYLMVADPTARWISTAQAPAGFPRSFAWAPTLVGWSSAPTSAIYRWFANYTQIWLQVYQGTATTSDATTTTLTLPAQARSLTNNTYTGSTGPVTDNSAAQAAAGVWRVVSNATTVEFFKTAALGTWTASGTKAISAADIHYEF